MKHLPGGGLVDWVEDDGDDVETVCVDTEKCVCAWAELNPDLVAEAKTVYWPCTAFVDRTKGSEYAPD